MIKMRDCTVTPECSEEPLILKPSGGPADPAAVWVLTTPEAPVMQFNLNQWERLYTALTELGATFDDADAAAEWVTKHLEEVAAQARRNADA